MLVICERMLLIVISFLLCFFPANGHSQNFLSHDRIKFILEETYNLLVSDQGSRCKQGAGRFPTQEAIQRLGLDYVDDSMIGYFYLCEDQFAYESMGNHLTSYFGQRACADVAGTHYLAIHSVHEGLRSHATSNHKFYTSLPKVFVHPHPINHLDFDQIAEERCVCVWNCLSDPKSPYLTLLPWMRETFHNSLVTYVHSVNLSAGTIINPDWDLSTAPPGTFLPIVPDVTIHYRCGDNVDVGRGMVGHGLMPFPRLLPLIPRGKRYIYILSDSPVRFSRDSAHVYRCGVILKWLHALVVADHPRSTVVVKRGGDHFVDMARMAFADTFISAASTFSYFSAIANNGSNVYFPISELFPPSNTTIGDHFHWIENPNLWQNGWPMPWYLMRYFLLEKPITLQDCENRTIQGRTRSVYLVKDGMKHEFNSGEIFLRLGYDFGNVWHLDHEFVNGIPQGVAVDYISPPPVASFTDPDRIVTASTFRH